MAGEILSFSVQKLWDLLSHEYEQFEGVKDQVTELKTDLNTLRSFLKDADTKKHTSAMVRNCVNVIKEIIFDAEDIIETFVLKDELGKSGGIKKRIRRLTCIIPERREVALQIGSLSKRILKVIHDMETFGVQRIIDDVKVPQPCKQRLEFAGKHESNLVGMEENVKTLVGYLVERDDVQVVSITGMGGLGKTTLARQAFHDKLVKKKFDRLTWVCVSQVCDRMKVWQAILQNFRPNEDQTEIQNMTEATLQGELFRLLETSNSLIVLDDIWKEEDWDMIKPIFPHTKGSKVLLTSRNERVVVGRGETYILFKPDCLSDHDSWTLFQRIAMPSEDVAEVLNSDNKEMEEMGKQMIKHCWGLPLAVRVLGGLLAEKYTLHDWKRVCENIGPRLRDDNSFNRVLSLSFEELPSYLKCCFLYLAHFPEDYEINVEKLAYYWAAEGILRYNNDGECIQDVGDRYVEELVRRNMVISERSNATLKFETCCLHDLMREICLSKAEEENFLQIVATNSRSLSISRRFVSHHPTTLHAEREINNSKVRSLVVVRKDKRRWGISSLSFARYQMLRVLHLPSVRFEGEKLPSSIGKLIHLRYLNLEGARVSFHLPASLRNLTLLIYLNLNIGICFLTMSNNVLNGMKELRFLALPSSLHKKTKLDMSNLVNLETLINFSTENCSLEDLRGMARLRSLVIKVGGETSLETLSASIGGLRHLENLDVSYRGEAKEWGTQLELEFINLKQLKLSIDTPILSNGGLQFPSRLTCLFLEGCLIEEDPMSTLEKLLHLKEVSLQYQSFCGKKMVCSAGGFPRLQKLELCRLDKLEEWIVEDESMPLLHTLRISWCHKLKEIPDGLRFLYSLKHGDLDDVWEDRLSEGGEDYYKVKHIPSLQFYATYRLPTFNYFVL